MLYVSLFTREWIEMSSSAFFAAIVTVSLFTREWIEMNPIEEGEEWCDVSLPLYEGVD